jgi:regulator of replication initiation timing
MIGSFLRLFSQYRDLAELAQAQARNCESLTLDVEHLTNQLKSAEHDIASLQEANQELTTENLRLQDRLDAAIEDKQNLWSLVHESLDGERYALHTQVNHATQRAGGGIPYPEASTLPEDRVARLQKSGPVGRAGRMLPSQIALRAERDGLKNWARAMSESNVMQPET